MSKKLIECSHCLLGNGYSSLIASHILMEKGAEPIVAGPSFSGHGFDLQLSNCNISPIPVFPVVNSGLEQVLKLGQTFPSSVVEIDFSETRNCNISDFRFTPNSLAAFVYKGPDNLRSFIISYKQWGSAMLSMPFSEVQKKVNRHYLSGNNNSRLGFLEGFSLYYHFVHSISPKFFQCKTLEKIDLQNRILFTGTAEIHYQRLISTIPIKSLFNLCRMNLTKAPLYQGAYFFYFSHLSDFKAGKIIYDCDFHSDILRLYAATNEVIIVQLLSSMKGKMMVAAIESRLKELIPDLDEVKFEKELYLPMCYPIESIEDVVEMANIEKLKEHSVIPFGRLGNWEYKDLHELNWETIF